MQGRDSLLALAHDSIRWMMLRHDGQWGVQIGQFLMPAIAGINGIKQVESG